MLKITVIFESGLLVQLNNWISSTAVVKVSNFSLSELVFGALDA